MSDDRYRFNIGSFECIAIKDSEVKVDRQQVFSNKDRSEIQPFLKARGEKSEEIVLSYTALAIFSDDWVLIDAGIGNLGDHMGQLAHILDDEDIRPEHIILTHAHTDHFGGLVDADGTEAFGNVPIYMCQNEWLMSKSNDYAIENPRRATLIQDYLIPIERQIEPIECLNMNEILPGISVLRLPGHTAYHIGLLIESENDTLIYTSDAMIHPLHLEHLDWECGFDADATQARESRIKLAELAIELNAKVMSYHFAFPSIGRIKRNGDGYQWVAETQ